MESSHCSSRRRISDSLFHLSRSCLAEAPSVNANGTSSCWPLGTATLCKSCHSFQTSNCMVSIIPQSLLPFPINWDGLSKFFALALHLFRSVECVYWGVPSADPGFVLLQTSLTRWSLLSSWQGRFHNITASWMNLMNTVSANPGMLIGTKGLWTFIKLLWRTCSH